MPGVKNIGFGLLWAIGAVIIFVVTDRLFYVALIAGGIQFCIGLFQWISYSLKSDDDKQTHQLTQGLRALYQAMVSVALADGSIDDDEIEAILTLFKQLTGQDLTSEQVKEAADNIGHNRSAFIKDLKSYASQIDEGLKSTIVQACLFVAVADGDFGEIEQQHVGNIATALGFSTSEYDEIVGELLAEDD